MDLKKLPIGVESFSDISGKDYYYVDKTGFIEELIRDGGVVNLFTRPRRFGKSLNMSMLKTFFEIGGRTELFEGLEISGDKELCEKYMGKFPVISITLKGACGLTYNDACAALKHIIGNEAMRFRFLKTSSNISDEEKEKYQALINIKEGSFTMTQDVLVMSLLTLCSLLSKHYGQRVILLIDEYDVPLDKAFEQGYYDEMVSLLRELLGNALKTNDNMEFAVLTGCLRISKESIFTGLNNLRVNTITDIGFDEYFGFTDNEVKEMLDYYGLSDEYETAREWYDGYLFGDINVYCPWDVINFCSDARRKKQCYPQNYWANTSGNNLVRRFIDKADYQTKRDIEQLTQGKTVVKPVRQDITYNDMDTSIENLWSVLLVTGYLTNDGQVDSKRYRLKIPNREIHELFEDQIEQWFADTVRKDSSKLDEFCSAFLNGDVTAAENLFNDYLWNTISIRDTAVQMDRKENFYHGVLLGLLSHRENWLVQSNAESGEGYSDILVEEPGSRTGIVIELKYAEDGRMNGACEEALRQIEAKRYEARLLSDGMKTVIKYGIACHKKRCCMAKA